MGFGFVIVLAFKKDLLLFLITSIPGGGGACKAAAELEFQVVASHCLWVLCTEL